MDPQSETVKFAAPSTCGGIGGGAAANSFEITACVPYQQAGNMTKIVAILSEES